MKYSLKKIALITEIIGGVALFLSLIFVGIQFKENTTATKSATANAANAITVSWYTEDRKSVVQGKCVDDGGRGIMER